MVKNSEVFSRRILTFPAVRPCGSVSSTTLLASLINLAHIICGYKSKIIYTNRRNSREFIRLVEVLLIFLEEIRSGSSEISSSVFLSLSELHFIFQRVQYLLEDCTRNDARVLMLMKAEQVSNQFRVLIRAIALALEILPLNSVDVSAEVKELVELVRRQATKARFEIEPNDKRVSEKILTILSQFKEQIVPEPSDLKWVLGNLGIRSWSESNKEVKFFDSEIGLEWLTTEKRDVGILSSLMGFMIYCRCTLFDAVESESIRQFDRFCSSEVIKCLNVDDFQCPISLEIMTDPVTVATGHTYDRSSILKWFRSGNRTCPKTGKKLICTDLVPNLALKLLTKQYCLENCIPFADHQESEMRNRDKKGTVIAGSVSTEKAVKMVANFLVGRLVDGTNEEQNKAAHEIRLLTKTSFFNRSCLVESGAIPHLLDLLSSADSLTRENAIAALLNLSKNAKSKRIIVENGGLELILNVLKDGARMVARQQAAGVLFYLASVEEYRILIGENPEIIPSLIELLWDGTNRGKKNALVAIFGLIMYPDNHWRVLSAGLVPLLVNLLPSFEREDLVIDSMAVLATLAEKLDGTMAVLSAGALPLIVGILSSSTSRVAKEYCASLLLSLCINGGADVVPVLVKNPSLVESLYSLLTEGSSRASRNASSLIRILHDFNEKISSGLMTPALPREQFIHVR
ncbi:unnamed protein product [Ilex paraguariensis]|uniref:RING-type E3 ubiquitin transferase n=1 Tax=Ilex paraguariensis TaxID=185542 RepID=A0ABC8QZC1_9AQUA